MKHIEELGIVPHFAPSETKHLLPFFRPNIINNLFTISQTYIKNGYSKTITLAPDQTLTSDSHPHYDRIQIMWNQDFDEQQEHLRKTLSLGTLLINYLHSLSINGRNIPNNENSANIIQKAQIYAIQSKVNSEPIRYDTFQYQTLLCCYNFIKYQDKILLLFGFIRENKNNLTTLLGNVRQWNLTRLKIPLSQYDFQRLDRTIQHIFTASRSFMREVSIDYNTYRKNLMNFLEEFHTNEVISDDRLYKLCHTHKLFESNLQYSIKLLKTKIMYRNLTEQDVWGIICKYTTQMILQAPINISCSYAVKQTHVPKQGTIYISFALHYKSGQQKLPNTDNLNLTTKQIVGLLVSKVDIHVNLLQQTDLVVKNSLTFLQKYQKSQNPLNKSMISNRSYQQSRMNQSFISNASNLSQIRKINMKKIAKLENQIYQILKLLDSNQPILSPMEIEDQIVKHCLWLEDNYKNQEGYQKKMAENQYLMLESIKILVEELTPQDINLLLKSNINQSSSILSTFMQPFNYDKTITLGKIFGLQNLQLLFQQTLTNGFSVHRHSLIPFFLKKLLQAYTQSPKLKSKTLALDYISIPSLIQLLQTKQYKGKLYSSFVSTLIPQLFTEFQSKLKTVSPLLYLYTQHLLHMNHHKELVYSFIGQLIFQIIYFQNQTKLNSLSNMIYMEDSKTTQSLKQKKILELLREGGFHGYGYEVRNQFYPIIENNKSFRFPDQIVYNLVRVRNPIQTLNFFKILSKSHITSQIIKFGKFYSKNNHFSNILQRGQPMLCFILVNSEPIFNLQTFQQQQAGQEEYTSISRRVLTSQSGIFQELVTLNPKIKIAGIELASAMKNLTDSRIQRKLENKFKNYTIDKVIAVQSIKDECNMQNYENVELAISLKDKYIQYHTLNEESKSYFRDCASSVVQQKQKIMKYIALSNKAKSLRT